MDKCMGTLLHQDLDPNDYEIILVNDGSPDNSLELANQYAEEHSNVHVISYDVNRGLAAARQIGTDAAQGRYLSYVDPDDYIATDSYAVFLERMDRDNLDMLRLNYQMVNENYEPLFNSDFRHDYSPRIMNGKDFLNKRLGNACFVWAFIYRTAFIKESGVRFREGDYFDDTVWLPQILRQAKRIDSCDVVHYYYLQ